MPIISGEMLHAQVRYFDPENSRAGLPAMWRLWFLVLKNWIEIEFSNLNQLKHGNWSFREAPMASIRYVDSAGESAEETVDSQVVALDVGPGLVFRATRHQSIPEQTSYDLHGIDDAILYGSRSICGAVLRRDCITQAPMNRGVKPLLRKTSCKITRSYCVLWRCPPRLFLRRQLLRFLWHKSVRSMGLLDMGKPRLALPNGSMILYAGAAKGLCKPSSEKRRLANRWAGYVFASGDRGESTESQSRLRRHTQGGVYRLRRRVVMKPMLALAIRKYAACSFIPKMITLSAGTDGGCLQDRGWR